MYQVRLPISLLKLVYGLAVVTENGSWATKHTAWLAEKTSLVAEKVAEAAQNTAYYAKEAAKGIKNLNEKIERKARETKEEYQQAIRQEEFRQINQEIAEGSEKYNPHLVEATDAEFADGVLFEKE